MPQLSSHHSHEKDRWQMIVQVSLGPSTEGRISDEKGKLELNHNKLEQTPINQG